jgi:hypothetical protein
MAQEVLLVVDNDGDIRDAMERDLQRRFATDYRIITAETRVRRWQSSALATRLRSHWQANG